MAVLSLIYMREHPAEVRQALANRGADAPLDLILELDARHRSLLQEVETLRAQRNQLSSDIGGAYDRPTERQRLVEETRAVSARIDELEPQLRPTDVQLYAAMLQVPNMPDPSVPVGRDDSDDVEVRRWDEAPSFDFTPSPHWEIGERLGVLDSARGAKLAGSRFHVLSGHGAALSRALISFMLDLHTREHGYTEIAPPYLVKPEMMVGTGQLPKFAEEAYYLERDDLYLIPTAEVPVINLHRDETLSAEELPRRYCSYTACFRREAGAAGKDTRGLIRVHQFDKVELVKLTAPEDSDAELESMVRDAEDVLQRLGLAYRVVLLCTGAMGFAMAKTYDLEVWMPGQGRYVEISSCSSAAAFQARRADIKYRPAPGVHAEYLHTLNGSGVAVGRTIAALLETFQRPDGSVGVPTVLRSYLGGLDALLP